jgi:hypothetical protein
MIAAWLVLLPFQIEGIDSEQSRNTMQGIKGVHVIVEDLQPNLQKYARKQEISRERLQALVESRLRQSGIRVLAGDEWLSASGRPVLYVCVNSHEYEKYQFAYDVSVELQQLASPEAAPSTKVLAATWSAHITGAVTAGAVRAINERVEELIDVFVNAYRSVQR